MRGAAVVRATSASATATASAPAAPTTVSTAAVPASAVPTTRVPGVAVRVAVGPPTGGRHSSGTGSGTGGGTRAGPSGRLLVLGEHERPHDQQQHDRRDEEDGEAHPLSVRIRRYRTRCPADESAGHLTCLTRELETVRRCEAGATGHSHRRTAPDGAPDGAVGPRRRRRGAPAGLPPGQEGDRRSPCHRTGSRAAAVPGMSLPATTPHEGRWEGRLLAPVAVGWWFPGCGGAWARQDRCQRRHNPEFGGTGRTRRTGPVRPALRRAAPRRAGAPSGRDRRHPARAATRPAARRPRRPEGRHRHCGRRR